MPFASDNRISKGAFAGSVEITDAQYSELMIAQVNGRGFEMQGGVPVILSDTDRTVYSTENGKEETIPANATTPDGYTDMPRPDEFHDFESGEWALNQQRKDAARVREIDSRLQQIDTESVRPLRAINSGNDTQVDHDRLAELDIEAVALRNERAGLV